MFLTRDMWGASKDHKRLGRWVGFDRREGVVIHHTVTVDPDHTPNQWGSLGDISAQMRKLQTIRPELGLDVPYNLVVFMREGDHGRPAICEGRGLMRSAAHASGLNTSHIGVAFAGNFERWHSRPMDLQIGYRAVMAWLSQYQTLGLMLPEVMGHRDVKPTACPGQFLYDVLPDRRSET